MTMTTNTRGKRVADPDRAPAELLDAQEAAKPLKCSFRTRLEGAMSKHLHQTNAVPRLALRPKEAATALGISERKLWEITADRTSGIPHVRFGKAILYPLAELQRWLADQALKGAKR